MLLGKLVEPCVVLEIKHRLAGRRQVPFPLYYLFGPFVLSFSFGAVSCSFGAVSCCARNQTQTSHMEIVYTKFFELLPLSAFWMVLICFCCHFVVIVVAVVFLASP